jgi:hypothetical protein
MKINSNRDVLFFLLFFRIYNPGTFFLSLHQTCQLAECVKNFLLQSSSDLSVIWER